MEGQTRGKRRNRKTAATRLVWATGYFVDVDYYLLVDPCRRTCRNWIAATSTYLATDWSAASGWNGSERAKRRLASWSWFKNPFTGTKEMNGLRVMMALIGNWDLKEINNAIYSEAGRGAALRDQRSRRYLGKTGNSLDAPKNNPEAIISETKFIQKVHRHSCGPLHE